MTLKNPFIGFEPKVAARRPEEPEPDLTAVHVEHRGMRTDTSRLVTILGDQPGDERIRAVGLYTRGVVSTILRHHQIEDHITWPILRACAGTAVHLDPITEDHDRLDSLIEEALRLADLLAAGDRRPTEELRTVLAELHRELSEHIDEEERTIYTAYLRYVPPQGTSDEMAAALAGYPPEELPFMLPYLAHHATAEEEALLAEGAGPPWAEGLAAFGPDFQRLRDLVFPA